MSRLYACQGRHPITSWKAADKEAKRLRRKFGRPVGHYSCPYCGMRHIGRAKQ